MLPNIKLPQSSIEHFNRVDLKARPITPEWQITTYLPDNKLIQFTDKLEKKKLIGFFHCNMRRFIHANKLFIFFRLKSIDDNTDYLKVRSLLRLLHDLKMIAIWKEGEYGYKVSPHGDIRRKWKLTREAKPYNNFGRVWFGGKS